MRITGGRLKNRPVPAPQGLLTRPTTEAMREALFSSLSHRCDVTDLDILDCYCGSGILAFEALSRGARSAVMIDHDPDVCRLVRTTATSLDVSSSVTIMRAEVMSAIRRLQPQSFDLVFADPPYALRSCNALIALLHSMDIVRHAGLVVLEHDDIETLLPHTGWEHCATLSNGPTVINIIRRVPTSS